MYGKKTAPSEIGWAFVRIVSQPFSIMATWFPHSLSELSERTIYVASKRVVGWMKGEKDEKWKELRS